MKVTRVQVIVKLETFVFILLHFYCSISCHTNSNGVLGRMKTDQQTGGGKGFE